MRTFDEPSLHELVTLTGESWKQELIGIADEETDAQLSAITDCMDRHHQQLASLKVWGPPNRLASSRLWQIVGSQLRQGSLQLHARDKPLGYAGDFRLLERICQEDVQGTGIGALFDRYFQSHAAPQAVRNRATILAGELVGHFRKWSSQKQDVDSYHIVSYGSGPAFDLHLACGQLTESERARLSVTLLDLDPAALAFASERLTEHLTRSRITATRVNLSRIVRQPSSQQPFAPADFVFAAGYFDYLELADAARAIRFLWSHLRPSGQLCVFNFGESNPSRAYMEWVANWYLIHRTDNDMRALATESDLPTGSWSVSIEPAGVNRYLSATKPN